MKIGDKLALRPIIELRGTGFRLEAAIRHVELNDRYAS